MDIIYVFAVVLLRADAAKPPISYRLGEPLVDKADTLVRNILSAGGEVFVFAEDKVHPAEPITLTLAPPIVTQLISAGGAPRLREYLEMIETPETITEVHTLDGKVWKLNEVPPGESSCTIVRMVRSERGIEIVTLPKEGSELAKSGLFLVFTLMPMTFVRVQAKCDPVTWKSIQDDVAAMIEEEEDDDEEEEEEEEEEVLETGAVDGPVQAPVQSIIGAIPPPPPPAPPLPNGAGSQPTSE
jgi:hypothetical protein